jgi:hypothetical protein
LSTTCNPEPFTIIEKHGNSVVIQSNEGEKYKRNVTHVKKFIEREASDNNNLHPNNSSAGLTPVVECGVDLYIFKYV